MPTAPRPRIPGTDDDEAALAFAAADAERPELVDDRQDDPDEADDAAARDAARAGDEADAMTRADDLARAREARIRSVLDFEAGWSSHGGAKARAIRAEFGWTTTRYYQVLDAALETPEALHHDPMLVRRLLRLRDGA